MYITRNKAVVSQLSNRMIFNRGLFTRKAQIFAAGLSISAQATLTDLMQLTGHESPTITGYNSSGNMFGYLEYEIATHAPDMINDNLNDGVSLGLSNNNSDPNSPYFRAVIHFPTPQDIKSIYLLAQQPETTTFITALCSACQPPNMCDDSCMTSIRISQWYVSIYAGSSATYSYNDMCAEFVQGNGTFECIKTNVSYIHLV